jgi:ankyrin repeat protein
LNSRLERGANVLAVDNNGQTPLHYAAQNNYVSASNYLLDKGAVLIANSNGQTPLHCAAQNNHVEVSNCLLDKGADILAVDNRGQTPLHYAFESLNIKYIKALLYRLEKRGDDLVERALVMQDNRYCTPTYYARNKSSEWIDQLIYIGRYHGNE